MRLLALRPLSLALLSLLVATGAQAAIAPGQPYVLTAKAGGLVLDNRGQTDRGQMGLWSRTDGNTNQQWRPVDLGGGRYMFVNLTSGMALDDSGSTATGAIVTQYDPSTSNPNQQWTVVDGGDGYVQLVNVASGKALDNGGSSTAGSLVKQWDVIPGNPNQLWSFDPVQIGARTPFTTFEAEQGATLGGATVVALTAPPPTRFSSAALEASGHAYVHLAATGQQVSWTNTTGSPMTAINLRYSIPDAPQGGGIDSGIDLYVNGTLRQVIPVTSRQTWVYETQTNYNGMSQDPSSGQPHVFWDEAHAFVSGAPIQPGDVVTVRKDAGNSAAWYDIDLIELEAPPAPLTQPDNSLSLTDCGAVANDRSFDSTSAIQSCFDKARTQGKSVWIPQGTFYTTRGLTANGITIAGAGMWYSTLYSNVALGTNNTNAVIQPTSTVLRNFAIDGNAVDRTPQGGNRSGINIKGSQWHIDSLWIQHEGAAVWANGQDGLVENCRINNSWADGINLNNGNTVPGNDTGNRLTARNNFVRGTGDDGLAINDGGNGTQPMHDITVIQNTSVAPWWANNIGIYGGNNDVVANNLAQDSVKQYGLSAGVFGNFGPLGSAWIEGNTVIRGGSFGYGNRNAAVGLGISGTTATVANIAFRGNTIVGAMFDGLRLSSQTNAVVQATTMLSPGLNGYIVPTNTQGNATLLFNHLDHPGNGQAGFVNGSPATFSIVSRGNDGLGIP